MSTWRFEGNSKMLLWRLYWSKYDPQGLRVPRTWSERSLDRHKDLWTVVPMCNLVRIYAYWKAKQMNLTLAWLMFYKIWQLLMVHWKRVWPRKGLFSLKNSQKIFAKISSYWRLQEHRIRPEQTYDVSFSVYYQGFYDRGFLEFLENGSMNGSGRFSNCDFES